MRVQFSLGRHASKESLLEAIEAIPYEYGTTNTADAFKALRTEVFSKSHGDRKKVPNVAVLITDGNSNINVKRTYKEANRSKRRGMSTNNH